MTDALHPLLDLELIVDVPLTPAQLFDGWTNPDTLKQWFCPRPWRVTECSIDLRPGGLFSNVMQSPDGELMPENRGCYLLIERPTRLEGFLHLRGSKKGRNGHEFLLTDRWHAASQCV